MSFKKLVVLLVFLATLIEINSSPTVFSNQNSKLSITPLNSYPLAGESFTINVTVTNVTDLCGWQIYVSYNPSVINCVEVTIPADNIFAGHETIGGALIHIYNELGLLTASYALWELQGVNGSGKLCQIKFNTSFPGISILTFINGTYLLDSKFVYIPFEATEGIVRVVGSNYQLYVFNVTQNETSYNITIYTNSNITDFNFSRLSKKMSFTAANRLNSTGFCTVCVPKALLNDTFAVLANGTALPYNISSGAVYQCLQFNLGFNILDINVLTTIIGDLNGDRKVEMKDIAIAARAFGSVPGDSRWDPRADLNRDVKVDMKDITIIAKSFGKAWQS